MIIGITGKKRSGKDTVASLLGYEKRSFADPLKACQVIFNLRKRCTSFFKKDFADCRNGNTLPTYMNIWKCGWREIKGKM